MGKIKTRESVKDVKVLDKAATAAERMRDAYIRTKDGAEQAQGHGRDEYSSPSEYAEDRITRTADDAVHEAAHQVKNLGGKAVDKVKDVRRSRKDAKQAFDGARGTANSARNTADGARKSTDGVRGTAKGVHKSADGAKNSRGASHRAQSSFGLPKDQAQNRAREAAKRSNARVRQAKNNAVKATRQTADKVKTASRTTEQSIKTVDRTAKTARQSADTTVKSVARTEKTIRQSVRSAEKGIKTTAKGTVKTAEKSIKTAEKTAKTTVKTTQQAAKAAQKTAQATAKAAKMAAQAARTAARATVRAVRIAVKATISAVKAIIAATKALVSAIAAGGWVAVAVILIICMVALLVCSVFGIFFSSESGVSENGMTMKAVVSQINTEFAGELARIQRENPHDSCEITANRALWKDILAVYAVRTNTDSDNPLDVITLDDEKIELLRTVFWDMNIIDYWIEEIEHTSTTTNEDGSTDTDTWYEYILHITVTGKTVSEMAKQYGFNARQRELLEELLRPEYDELWASLLAGAPSGGGTGTISLGIYIWPSSDSDYITSFFGTRIHPIYGDVRHHNGIDIGAAYGTDVLAAADGTVTLAGWNGGYGYCVIIDHGDGNQTLYAHMSQLSVSAGQTVTQGQTVGFVGSTGDSTGPHLHFETFVNGSRVDPLLYFDNYSAAW